MPPHLNDVIGRIEGLVLFSGLIVYTGWLLRSARKGESPAVEMEYSESVEQLEGKNAKLIVTLSYYIEPNPGTRRLATHYAYHSHQLDFEIINRSETLEEFKVRISKPENETKENRTTRTGVKWAIGKDSILKGSIRKDFITETGRALSVQNIIAVIPKNGWYKNLKRQKKHNEVVRYSLIVSIETEETEVDLYTPVFNVLNPLTV